MRTSEFVDGVVARVEKTPVDISHLGTDAIPASVFSGGAGVALFLVEMARLRKRDDLLPLARRWLAAARGWAAGATPEQWADMRWGVAQGVGGCSYVEALLSAREKNASGVLAAVSELEGAAKNLHEKAQRPTELLAGYAGVVRATRDLETHLSGSDANAPSLAVLARTRAAALAPLVARHGEPLHPGPNEPLGLGHGLAGEIWALQSELGARHELVSARLRELSNLKELDEEGLVFWFTALDIQDTALLGSWCNGLAGHTLLWCDVAREGGDDEAKELARQCAESSAILMNGSATVCCGLGGTSIALERYAALSGDKKMARRAYDRLRQAIEGIQHQNEGMYLSLWQGTIGVALLAARRIAGEHGLPCIEPRVRA